jgi:hypothetical protein
VSVTAHQLAPSRCSCSAGPECEWVQCGYIWCRACEGHHYSPECPASECVWKDCHEPCVDGGKLCHMHGALVEEAERDLCSRLYRSIRRQP